MSARARWFLWAVTATALLSTALTSRPEWSARVGLDYWTIPELTREVEEGRRDLPKAREDARRLGERVGHRNQVLDDLCGGRVGMFEAAARFRDLSPELAGGPDPSNFYAGNSEGERYCRQVIWWVRRRAVLESSAEASRLADRLEDELGERLRREGEIRLPR
jgi:hypothetical protein